MNTANLSDNIAKLSERVRLAAQKSQRDASDILLLAVSKKRAADDIREAHKQGLEHFGENYLQEALPKIEQLSDLGLTWHFIGPIQSNKTRQIASHFDWVHSVEREKIARRLSEQRPQEMSPLQLCLQVNISGEDSKSGVSPAKLPELAREVAELPGLQLRGLMAIPEATDDTEVQHQAFATLKSLLEQLRCEHPSLDTLSMGMSADLEAAIAEGATLIRVGTAIFGPRDG
jgi:pyridoxal phosphate enzyme (YggS family)